MNPFKKILLLHLLLFSVCTLFAQNSRQKYDIVVAADGSGRFRTIQEAINAAPDNQTARTVIFVKKGVYKEKVVVEASKKNLTIIGEDLMNTVITYDDYSSRVVGSETINTNTSFSFAVNADGFIAEHITFENSAGNVGQAVAMRIISDRVIFRNCRFIGNQDTLLTNGTGRIYFSNCYIEGTTDFIFGSAIALFEDCRIFSKKNSYVTAASTPQGNQYGYVFKNCTLTADAATTLVYLGRPWRPYAKVVYIDCWLGKQIRPEGWDNWRNAANEKTAFYAEYKSKGPGANPAGRVAWSHQLTDEELKNYTTALIFGKNAGSVPYTDNWLPASK